MTNELKRWIPVCFPMGEFKGSVNIALKGKNVLSAKDAKELIDQTERQLANGGDLHANKINSTGSAGSEGPSTLPEGRELCPDVHADGND